eukprot:TRINITY_DN1565_c0_g1_i5.p1 TRINITY_DN1565_c0_g1~~TRINITY_DN1565_c0_g1_i5.p1  ORF type:complete len:850 (+),score=191.13 TRINITY_DN1565_c0_g1_i5:50-2599(+)
MSGTLPKESPGNAPDTPQRCRLRVSVVFIIAVTVLLSTLGAVLGGLILYWDGLTLIARAMEEVSRADTISAVSKLGQTFDSAHRCLNTSETVLRLMAERSTDLSDLVDLITRDFRARMVGAYGNSPDWGLGFTLVPEENTATDPAGAAVVVWSEDHSHSTVWASSKYVPAHWELGGCGENKPRCVHAIKFDPVTGKFRGLLYNYSLDASFVSFVDPDGPYARQQLGFEEGSKQWWRPPTVWTTLEGKPLGYTVVARVVKPLPIPLVHGLRAYVQAFYLLDGWAQILTESTTKGAHALATTLSLGMQSRVLADNLGVKLVKPGCSREHVHNDAETHRCFVKLFEMDAPTRDAAVILNRTAEGVFLREDIAGGDHWLLRRVINDMSPVDLFDTPHLLWLRPVSTVQSEYEDARDTFIVVVVCVSLLGVMAVGVQMLLIAQPLVRLRYAMEPVSGNIDVLEAQTRLKRVAPHCAVSEIHGQVVSFSAALNSLSYYRSFLPAVLLVDDTDNRKPLVTLHTERDSSISARSPSSVADDRSAKSEMSADVVRPIGRGRQSVHMSPNGHAEGGNVSPRRVSMFDHHDFVPRSIAFQWIGIRGFHSRIEGMDGPGARTLHSDVAAAIMQEVADARGVHDHLCGDRFASTFGALRLCCDRRKQAVVSALRVSRKLAKTQLQMIGGVSAGGASIGITGTEMTRRYVIVGPVVGQAHAFSRAAHMYSCKIIVGAGMHDTVSAVVLFRAVGVWEGKKVGGECVLFEAIQEREATESGEWMYELQRSAMEDPYAKFNEQFLAVVRGGCSPLSCSTTSDLVAAAPEIDLGAAFDRQLPPPDMDTLRDVRDGKFTTHVCMDVAF